MGNKLFCPQSRQWECVHLVCLRQAILGLFFQLSRYKQQQKQLQPPSPARAGAQPPASPAKYGLSSIPGNINPLYSNLFQCMLYVQSS